MVGLRNEPLLLSPPASRPHPGREPCHPAGDRRSLNNLGNISLALGDHRQARAYYEESLSILRNLGDRPGIARSLYNLGHVAMKQGDDASAGACLEESLRIRREMKHRGGTALCLNNLGVAALHRRDHDSAQSHFSEAIALRETRGGSGALDIMKRHQRTITTRCSRNVSATLTLQK